MNIFIYRMPSVPVKNIKNRYNYEREQQQTNKLY